MENLGVSVVSKAIRKRGRPKGGQKPLSKEEQKARNALYERQRREEQAAALAELAESIGLHIDSKDTEVMSTVLAFIKSREPLENMRRRNEQLLREVEMLENCSSTAPTTACAYQTMPSTFWETPGTSATTPQTHTSSGETELPDDLIEYIINHSRSDHITIPSHESSSQETVLPDHVMDYILKYTG